MDFLLFVSEYKACIQLNSNQNQLFDKLLRKTFVWNKVIERESDKKITNERMRAVVRLWLSE